MMGDRLKPCPFCGGCATLEICPDGGDDSALCLSCGATAFLPTWNAHHEATQVRVRDLEWEDYPAGSRCVTDSRYNINLWGVEQVWVDAYTTMRRRETLDEAKAAAQADYERRIRAALEPDDDVTPEAVAQLRESAKKEIENDEWHLIGRGDQGGAPADTVTGWQDISAEAEKAGLVLVMTDEETFHTAYWSLYNGGTWFIAGTQCSIQPRKWRPLPPAPEKEG